MGMSLALSSVRLDPLYNNIANLFGGAKFVAPLTSSAVPTSAASGTTTTFTRATTKTWPNNDGYQVTGVAGEIGFVGARRVRNLLSATEDFSSGSWTKDGVTASADTLTVSATTAEHRCYQLGATAPTACAMGVEVKAGTANFICLHKGNTGLYAVFNVATGAVVSSVGCTGRIESKGDGWYRCFADTGINTSYLMISVGDTAAHAVPLVTWLGAGQTIQVRKAQLEDVTAQTTQTAGEYVSVGVPANWAGTELVTNGTFDTATTGWTNNANATISVDTQRLKLEQVNAAGPAMSGQVLATVVGTKYVVSFDWVAGTQGNYEVYVGTSQYGFELVSSGIISTNHYTVTFTATTTTTYITLRHSTGATGRYSFFDNISVKPAYYHGSMVDGVKCFATDINGSPIPSSTLLGYQAEGARTNLCLQSQTFGTTWVKNESTGTVTITNDNGVAPDGTLTAEKIEFVAAAAPNQALLDQNIAVSAGSVYTGTIYVKAFAAGDVGKKLVYRHGAGAGYTELTLSANWQRLGSTETAAAAVMTVSFGLRPSVGGSSGTVTAYVWGAQVELGAFASSYIPTTTIAVARNADVLTYSSAGNISVSSGAWYFEETHPNASVGGVYISANNGATLTERLLNYDVSGNGGTRYYVSSNNVATVDTTFGTNASGTTAKRGMFWSANNVNAAINGTLGTLDTSCAMPLSLTQIEIGMQNTTGQLYGTIRNVRIWQRALSSSELQAVTS